MCLHPPEERVGFDALGRDVTEETYRNNFDDTCDYFNTTEKIMKDSLDLSILQLNVRGLASKKDDLELLLKTIEKSSIPDVVILCETWLTPSSPSINFTGYNFIHKSRTQNSPVKG